MSAPLPLANGPDLKAELAERAEACDENGLEASAVLHRQALARITQLEGQLANIATLIGNVDHSRGGGENTARLYGQMLNDIRTLTGAIESSPTVSRIEGVGL